MLPHRAEERQRYSIRNRNEFIPTFTRISYVKNSFFWSATEDWNALDHVIRISDSLNIFKHNLKTKLFQNKRNPLYDDISGWGAHQLARLRMGLFDLPFFRMKNNFLQFDNCPLCGSGPEDLVHFVIACPNLVIHRITLMARVSTLLALIPNFFLIPLHRILKKRLLTLIFGNSNLSFFR